MNFENFLKQKSDKKKELKINYSLNRTNSSLGLISLSQENLNINFINSLNFLKSGFVIETNNTIFKPSGDNNIIVKKISEFDLIGFDFIVTDKTISNYLNYFSKGIVPIIYKDNNIGNLLFEFNSMKNIGNSYLYDTLNEWSIFYSIVRYLENYKYTYDNKSLIRNVLDI